MYDSSAQQEWGFLCACASPASTSAEIEQLLGPRLNWDVLLNLAELHSVPGLVNARLREVSFGGVPNSAKEKLQIRMRDQHLFTLSMTAELFRLLQGFSSARIETMLVKGPVASMLAYGDPSMRSYADLDLLVRHRDIQAAVQGMREQGFQTNLPDSAILAGKMPGDYLFRKPAQRAVELHTEHSFRYYPRKMRIEDLFRRRCKVLLDNREVRALSLEDEFVLNCIHGAKHFWERLIWVADIAALVTNHPEMDWEKAKRAAAEAGAGRMLRVGVHLATALLRSPIPAALLPEIQKDRAVERLSRRIQTWLPYAGAAPPALPERALFRLKMAGGGITGASYLLRLTLSPTEEDWSKGEEERKPWLWDVVRRPFRLLRKYGSNE